jgi:hypothetical protein
VAETIPAKLQEENGNDYLSMSADASSVLKLVKNFLPIFLFAVKREEGDWGLRNLASFFSIPGNEAYRRSCHSIKGEELTD